MSCRPRPAGRCRSRSGCRRRRSSYRHRDRRASRPADPGKSPRDRSQGGRWYGGRAPAGRRRTPRCARRSSGPRGRGAGPPRRGRFLRGSACPCSRTRRRRRGATTRTRASSIPSWPATARRTMCTTWVLTWSVTASLDRIVEGTRSRAARSPCRSAGCCRSRSRPYGRPGRTRHRPLPDRRAPRRSTDCRVLRRAGPVRPRPRRRANRWRPAAGA